MTRSIEQKIQEA